MFAHFSLTAANKKGKRNTCQYSISASTTVIQYWELQNWTHLTQLSWELLWAFTHKAIQQCVALASILTRSALALVPLDFTVSTNETWWAQAVVTPRNLLKKAKRNKKLVKESSHCPVEIIFNFSNHTNMKIQTSIPCMLLHSDTDHGSHWSLKREQTLLKH